MFRLAVVTLGALLFASVAHADDVTPPSRCHIDYFGSGVYYVFIQKCNFGTALAAFVADHHNVISISDFEMGGTTLGYFVLTQEKPPRK